MLTICTFCDIMVWDSDDNHKWCRTFLSKKEGFMEKIFSKYQKIILERAQILLFNQQNNRELQHILNKNNIKYTHLTPSELGINFVKNFELIKYKNRGYIEKI